MNDNFAMADGPACRSPAFLREQINSILKFYAPVVRDPRGGFHNQLLDDGTVYDPSTKHVVGTCRFIVNYALAARVANFDQSRRSWAPRSCATLVAPRAVARAEAIYPNRFLSHS